MDADTVIDISQTALYILTIVSAPLLMSALAVGLVIGILQAATQVNEMTLSFIPKILAVILALGLGGHWILEILVNFTVELYSSIPDVANS